MGTDVILLVALLFRADPPDILKIDYASKI